ncbi:MAG: HAD family phosphatase [Candidatus Eremiobacteraeota bacterium]|nr:HAD family phosphatase [Candidatus Eremiobacteraeota bacterium]
MLENISPINNQMLYGTLESPAIPEAKDTPGSAGDGFVSSKMRPLDAPGGTNLSTRGSNCEVKLSQNFAGAEADSASGCREAHTSDIPTLKPDAPYALFDFDGTLSRGFISMDFLDYAHEKGLYSDKEYRHQMDILDKYKNKTMSYDDWVEEWGRSWARGLEGRKQSDLDAAAKVFFESFKGNIYPEAERIVAELRSRGYSTVMVSAGVSETADIAGRELGFDAVIATRCKVIDGVYTGELATSLHTASGKGKMVDELEAAYGAPTFAFGDSSGDIGMLSRSRHPVCLNPNSELRTVARQKGWERMPISSGVTYLQDVLAREASSPLNENWNMAKI